LDGFVGGRQAGTFLVLTARIGQQEALTITRREPPDLRKGGLLQELHGMVAEALAASPAGGRVLAFHSAVIAYLDVSGRELLPP
jgi:hypothetical protein